MSAFRPLYLIPRGELVVDRMIALPRSLTERANHLTRWAFEQIGVTRPPREIGRELLISEFKAGFVSPQLVFEALTAEDVRKLDVEQARRIILRSASVGAVQEMRWREAQRALVVPRKCVACGRWGYHLASCSRGGRR